jgi:hypothetical protein
MNCRSILLCATLSCIYSLGFGHAPLRANSVTFGLTGTVTAVDSPLTIQFAPNDTFTGTVTFNDATAGSYPTSDIGLYHNLFTAAHVSFSNGYVANFSGGNSDLVVDNTGPDLYESFVPVTGPNVSGMFLDILDYALRDDQNIMLTSTAIPTSPPSLALAEAHDGFLRFRSGQTSKFVSFNFTSLTAVPEPAKSLLLIVAAALLPASRRRPHR